MAPASIGPVKAMIRTLDLSALSEFMQSLAEVGFIVVQIDGMGTSNRSKAFHDVAWRDLKDAGFPDRILWHKAVAAKYLKPNARGVLTISPGKKPQEKK